MSTVAPAQLDPGVTDLIERSRAGASRRLRGRGLWSALAVGGLFVGAAVTFAALYHSSRSTSFLSAAALVLSYALASRAEFEVRTGSALPTQVVLVPMLLLLPLDLVPFLVALALLIGKTIVPGRGRAPLDRALLVPVYSWHVMGPVAVLALAGERPPRLGDWPIYFAAIVAQFAVDFAVSGSREWVVKGVRPSSQLPFMGWVFLVDAGLASVGLLAALAAVHRPAVCLLLLPLIGLLSVFAHERQMRIDHALELSHAYRGTAFLLGYVVEADDPYTGTHSRDVVTLVLDVCDELGLEPSERRDAEFAALLHDVGKIRIPGEIINKAGPLDARERAMIETHTLEGERLLSLVGGILGSVGRIIRSCHENWDGSGYPDGLVGEEIPLVARIVRCCDAFNAMTTDRPYRAARSVDEALTELRRCAGTEFDPTVVDALAATLATGS